MHGIELFSDKKFRHGFICGGAKHEDGIVGSIGARTGEAPSWKLAQWACRNNIASGDVVYTPDGFRAATVSQRVETSDGRLTLELLASREYDSPRISGQAWPHLLAEQTDLVRRCPPLGRVKSLRLRFGFMIPYFRQMMETPDPNLHAAQVTMFFTVQVPHGRDLPDGVRAGDMFWFGVPMFDSRYRHIALYKAEDGGKADASHKYIYTAAQRDFTEQSAHDAAPILYDFDMLPYMKEGLADAVRAGYLASFDPMLYTLTTCNIGFEMPGTFDAALELWELSLVAEMNEGV